MTQFGSNLRLLHIKKMFQRGFALMTLEHTDRSIYFCHYWLLFIELDLKRCIMLNINLAIWSVVPDLALSHFTSAVPHALFRLKQVPARLDMEASGIESPLIVSGARIGVKARRDNGRETPRRRIACSHPETRFCTPSRFWTGLDCYLTIYLWRLSWLLEQRSASCPRSHILLRASQRTRTRCPSWRACVTRWSCRGFLPWSPFQGTGTSSLSWISFQSRFRCQ